MCWTTSLKTCNLSINGNARFLIEMAKIYKELQFKYPSTVSSLPRSLAGNPPVTILLELLSEARKQTKITNMYHLPCRFYFRFQQSKTIFSSRWHNISKRCISKTHWWRWGSGERAKRSDVHARGIIKIHWIYCTGQNGWWQLGHIASVQMGSGVM